MFEPTRWWRAITPDGQLRLESSNKWEVQAHMKPGDSLQHLYEQVTVEGEWRDEE